MNRHRREDDHRVLAIDPTSRGFGYAVLEGPTFLADWGTRDLGRADSSRALAHVAALMSHYGPDVVALEDTTHPAGRRRERAQELIEAIARMAAERGVQVARVSRAEVHRLFGDAGGATKHRIAQAIAGHFPELDPRLPPARKAWMSEDTRMAIFDAAAFALAYYFRGDHAPTQPRPDQPHEPAHRAHGARA